MYSTIRRYKIAHEHVEEVLALTEKEFAPLISRLPGFVSYYLVDVGNGVVVGISIFEDKERSEASDRLAAEWVGTNLAHFIVYPPEVIGGEVRAVIPPPL